VEEVEEVEKGKLRGRKRVEKSFSNHFRRGVAKFHPFIWRQQEKRSEGVDVVVGVVCLSAVTEIIKDYYLAAAQLVIASCVAYFIFLLFPPFFFTFPLLLLLLLLPPRWKNRQKLRKRRRK